MDVYNYCSSFSVLFFLFFLDVPLFCVAAVPYFVRSVSSCSQNHISIYLYYIYTYIIIRQAAVFLPNPLVNNRLSLPVALIVCLIYC